MISEATDRKIGLKDYTVVDMLFVFYMLALSLLILFFHDGVKGWPFYIIVHAVVIFLILFFVPILNRSEVKILNLLRWWYPVLLFLFNYKEINAFTHIIFSQWMDPAVLEFEKLLFGVHPSLWMESFVSPFMTELMKFDYFTYYPMVWVSSGVLFFSGKRKEFIRCLATICIAFYISYIGFIVCPIRGPRYTLLDRYTKDYPVKVGDYYGPFVEKDVAGKDTMALKGYFFTNLQDHIMRYGSLHGGCMPSSHIAVAFVCMMMMLIYKRKIFYVYLPLVSLLCISVVYCRYHYISDVFAGLLVGAIAIYVTPYLMRFYDRFT